MQLKHIALSAFVLAWSTCVFAEVRKDKDLPKSGSLSSTRMTGQVSNAVPEPFGVVDPSGREVSPITGSVSRVDNDTWIMKVFNNSSTETYTVDVEVLQRDERGSVVKRDAYSYTLQPKATTSREVSSALHVRAADLNLTKYRNVTRRPKLASNAPKQGK